MLVLGCGEETRTELWARLGDAEAQLGLGAMLSAGRGVAKDDAEAARWYRLSAEQGLPMAQASLGACYLHGLGVEKDSVQAHAWLTRSVAGGFERVKPVLAQLEKALSPSERARSKRLVEQVAAAH